MTTLTAYDKNPLFWLIFLGVGLFLLLRRGDWWRKATGALSTVLGLALAGRALARALTDRSEAEIWVQDAMRLAQYAETLALFVKNHSLLWSVLLGVVGLWLLLPRGNSRLRPVGALLAAVSLGLLASVLPRFGEWLSQGLFWALAAATAAAAVATISMRSPVYSAIWFALTLLTTAGLFLLQGAQFLGMATVVVYAGAILVTFLFVLMLAQPEGHAYYDRISWGFLPTVFATLAGVLIVGALTHRLSKLESPPTTHHSALTQTEDLLHKEHVARLGNELFSKHLVSVEVAGTLLLVALVGAVAIMIQGRDTSSRVPAGNLAGDTRHG